MKNQNIVCIFAHPDDEAFGPSGTIAKWSNDNNVYLICVTDGSNPNGKIDKLALIRKKELLRSSKILGVKKVYFLKYCDGELRNNIYHKVADEIKIILLKIRPSIILTFEYRGISGHLDHIFVSMVSSYLFEKLNFIKQIYYFAENKLISNLMKDYFIYFPDGYEPREVDHIEDVSSVVKTKIKAAKTHSSQKKDLEQILKKFKYLPSQELYFIKEKNLKTKLIKTKYTTLKLSQALLQRAKKGRMI